MPSSVEDEAIFYEVGTLKNPAAEPFVVVRIDIRVPVEAGLEAIVQSTHWTREEAEGEAARLAGRLN